MRGIASFSLVTADLPRLIGFYRDVLGFAPQGSEQPIGGPEMALLGVSGGGRRQVLSLGRQTVSIEAFHTAGRLYPAGGNAASPWFQHMALVVIDMAAAYARLRDVTPISLDGPQRLPASSGGVQAFKFRDPDGHPLELLQFPAGAIPQAWTAAQPAAGQIGLGIDHSAISVADADASAVFYESLGLSIGKRTLNQGPAQQRLDGLPDVKVDVVPMMPREAPPHLELLACRVPKGGARLVLQANDVAATRIVWHGPEAALIRDPDGHLHQVGH